ncbi:MAG: MIP/aquaporin family protein [Nitrososphaeraceae archaeon]
MSSHLKEYLAEMMGTMILLFSGISIIIIFSEDNIVTETISYNKNMENFFIAILFSGTVGVIIISPFGKVSGAHINPAVSISFWLLNKMHHHDLIGYITFQFIGGIIGALLAKEFWGDKFEIAKGGMTLPGPGITPLEAFGAEIIMTFALVTTLLIILRHQKLVRLVPLIVWILIAIEIFFGSPISGTSINPARSIGPAVALNSWSDQWIYLTGPIIGSLIATYVYKKNLFGPLEIRTAKLFHTSSYGCIFLACKEEHRNAKK